MSCQGCWRELQYQKIGGKDLAHCKTNTSAGHGDGNDSKFVSDQAVRSAITWRNAGADNEPHSSAAGGWFLVAPIIAISNPLRRAPVWVNDQLCDAESIHTSRAAISCSFSAEMPAVPRCTGSQFWIPSKSRTEYSQTPCRRQETRPACNHALRSQVCPCNRWSSSQQEEHTGRSLTGRMCHIAGMLAMWASDWYGNRAAWASVRRSTGCSAWPTRRGSGTATPMACSSCPRRAGVNDRHPSQPRIPCLAAKRSRARRQRSPDWSVVRLACHGIGHAASASKRFATRLMGLMPDFSRK